MSIMAENFEFIKSQLGRVAPGDHRGFIREVEHGLKGIARVVT